MLTPLKRAAILIDLLEQMKTRGSWCGETHLQKSVFILQEIFGIEMYEDFILYKHGPFSFDLRDELTVMRANGLLDIKVQPAPYGPSLVPTREGLEVMDKFPKTLERIRKKTKIVAEELRNMQVSELEKLGTALYVIKKEGLINNKAYLSRFIDVKPHISEDEALSAKRDIDRLMEYSA